MESQQGKPNFHCINGSLIVLEQPVNKSKRRLDFLEPSRPICCLCQDHHTHVSSPKDWKNVDARRYLQSRGMSLDTAICRPCRQDVTRALADLTHVPRWEKGCGRSKTLCFVLNCSEPSIARARVGNSELRDIQFQSFPPPTPTPLCKHHYHVVYDTLQSRLHICRTCNRRLRGKDRPCPQPNVVEAYLREHTDFAMDISPTDRVCLTCYKSHLEILKQNYPTSTDEDLKSLVEGIRQNKGKDCDAISNAVNKILYDVGTMLLENQATLLPIICAKFHQYVREFAQDNVGVQESTELNSRRILCEIKAQYQHHVACVCKVRKYGTLVFRPTSDIHTLLTEALWKVKTLQEGKTGAKHQETPPSDIGNNSGTCTVSHINSLIHTQIRSYTLLNNYDELNVDEQIEKIEPQLWDAIHCMTKSTSEIRGSSKIYDPTSQAHHIKKIRCFFLLCVIMFVTDDRCSMPMHTLMTDFVDSQGGSSVLVRVLNRLGVCSSADTLSRFIQHRRSTCEHVNMTTEK